MKFIVDPWAPEYGSAAEETALSPSAVPTDIEVEVPVAQWGPRDVPADVRPPAALLFVDGVQRIEARLWITGDDGVTRQGICASFAAGAVRCDGEARLVAAEVRRVLLCPAAGAGDVVTRHGTFKLKAVSGDDGDALRLGLLRAMGDLEVEMAQSVNPPPGEPIVVDGPLRQHRLLTAAVGFIKTQHTAYGPPIVLETVAALRPGQRTPVMCVGEGFTRYSWYVRLPGEIGHALSGVVRCEADSQQTSDAVITLADQVTLALPRFASRPHKDPRAPQNLYPIAGLERELRRRLGDPQLLYRALRVAAARAAA